MGKVYLVGGGPGDSRLITAYGKELLEKADCVVYDRLIGTELLDLTPQNCEKIYVGKESGKHVVPQSRIQELLLEKSRQYSTVVRLKGGDPFVFGRGAEEAIFLNNYGVENEIVPGVTSAISALTYAGIPITYRGVSKGFRVITAHSKDDIMTNIDFSSMLDNDETYVFLMGLHHLKEITEKLIENGKSPDTPCAVISNATTSSQKTCISDISTIAESVREQKLTSPAIIVVGNVVKLSDKLSSFEKKSLFGKTLFVPYISGIEYSFKNGLQHGNQHGLIDELKNLGANVIPYQAGTIEIIEFDKDSLNQASVLAFSSKNAVYSFMSQIKDIRNIPNIKIAVVGKKTAEILSDFGLNADYRANTAEELGNMLGKDETVIHLCAYDNAHRIGADSIRIPCYKNTATNIKITDDLSGCDAAVFTCGSNAERIVNNINSCLPDIIFSIGESTTEILNKLKITNVIQAVEPTIKSVIEKITESL